jgi:DNA mismatch repair ATPase MutS
MIGPADSGSVPSVPPQDLELLAELLVRIEHQPPRLKELQDALNGSIIFDYKMQSGVVTHSNALALMRAVGLEV